MSDDRIVADKAFRAYLLGMEDTLGTNGLAAILRTANLAQYIANYPPSTMERSGHKARYFSQIAHKLEDIYGARGARAILQRVGRSQAKAVLEENALLVSTARLALQFLPLRQQMKLSLERTAHGINEQLESQARVVETADGFSYETEACSYCIDRQSDAPICHAVVGFFHGMLQNITHGEEKIQETLCHAKGDAMCKFEIALPS